MLKRHLVASMQFVVSLDIDQYGLRCEVRFYTTLHQIDLDVYGEHLKFI